MAPIPSEMENTLIQAIEQWVANHPEKQKPVLRLLAHHTTFSPADIITEIKARSEAGKELLELFEFAANKHSVDEVIRSLQSESLQSESNSCGS
jgi:hypothetical protein